MFDLILQVGLSNAGFSLMLAVVALVVGAATKRPHLAYLLWLLVIVKLVTPPIVAIPVEKVLSQSPAAVAAMNSEKYESKATGMSEFIPVGPTALPAQPVAGGVEDASHLSQTWYWLVDQGRAWLPPIWLLGSAIIFVWSLVHVFRFNRLLAAETETGPERLQAAAKEIAQRLELEPVPIVYTTSARLSPMVWWCARNVRVIVPATLFEQMDADQWRWVLAHELAHVRRRDYLVRWLEWLAGMLFWWNPVVWWAQYNLRAMEEICCDALVISSLKPKPRSYANSLLKAVEFLAYPAISPPAMASEINSGGFFVRRFKMIVSNTPNRVTSAWIKILILAFAIVVLPLGAYLSAAGKEDAKHKEHKEKQKTKQEHKEVHSDKTNAYLEDVALKFKQMVADGKITEAEAKAKYAAIEITFVAEDCEEAKHKAWIAANEAKLEYAAAIGKIAPKEAKSKMDQLIKEYEHLAKEKVKIDDEFRMAWITYLEKYFNGMIEFKEVMKAVGPLKYEICPEPEAQNAPYIPLKKYISKFEEEVAAGRMTPAEATNNMLVNELASYADACNKYEQEYYLIQMESSLALKVVNGEMTEEEAEAKMAAIEEKINADVKDEEKMVKMKQHEEQAKQKEYEEQKKQEEKKKQAKQKEYEEQKKQKEKKKKSG